MGSAGFRPVGAGLQPATHAPASGCAPMTTPRASCIRQDAGCHGLEARAPLFNRTVAVQDFTGVVLENLHVC